MESGTYTVAEVARMLGLSRQVVTELFENERGTIVLHGGGTKRTHRTLRIPHAVYARVLKRLTVK